ncbi:MAG: polyprenyl synthetase family protein, partial [Flavobacteriaceae bacterium]|nr:polyprenyl synthetase family protein [Flavobacteriaceae bacterium]
DDYLDTFGDPKSFGKVVGGDIMENKKTYLYLKALSECSDIDKKTLLNYYQQKLANNEEKINAVKNIFETNEIPKHIKLEIEKYTQKAFDSLGKVNISSDKKEGLKKFGEDLMKRNV